MRTVVLGFSDINGRGHAKLLAGPDIPQSQQALLVTGIKSSGKYPDGLVRVEFCEIVARNVGVCIKTANELKLKDAAEKAKRDSAFLKAEQRKADAEAKSQGVFLAQKAEEAKKLQAIADAEKAKSVKAMTATPTHKPRTQSHT